jgi:hypothetical protein
MLQPHQTARHSFAQTTEQEKPDDTGSRVQHVRRQRSERTRLCTHESESKDDDATCTGRTCKAAITTVSYGIAKTTHTETVSTWYAFLVSYHAQLTKVWINGLTCEHRYHRTAHPPRLALHITYHIAYSLRQPVSRMVDALPHLHVPEEPVFKPTTRPVKARVTVT